MLRFVFLDKIDKFTLLLKPPLNPLTLLLLLLLLNINYNRSLLHPLYSLLLSLIPIKVSNIHFFIFINGKVNRKFGNSLK